MRNLSVNIAGVTLKNPVTTASGTFASGREYAEFVDLNRLGAVTAKGVSAVPWQGNPPARIAETYGGMLNCIGLQNPGVDYFINEDYPFLRKFDTKIILNIAGHSTQEYCDVINRLNETSTAVDLLELNISCPNISGTAISTDAKRTEETVSAIKKQAKQPLIVKLSPNVTDITEIARAAEAGGADGLSMINTLLGMRIDINRRAPILSNKVGGFSGPAVKPVAVRMVYQTAKAVSIPIIGMGGISTGEDAIEFIMAGATAVAVGTANFSNPMATVNVIDGIVKFMEKNNISDINEIRGIVK